MNKNIVPFLISIPVLIFLHFCSSNRLTIPPSPTAQEMTRLAEADLLYQKGDFYSLEKACELFRKLLSTPSLDKIGKEKLLKTTLLLALRTKELGILDDSYIEQASVLIRESSILKKYEKYLNFVQIMQTDLKGITGKLDRSADLSVEEFYERAKTNTNNQNEEIKALIPNDIFYAYFYLSLHENFPHWIEEKCDFQSIFEHYPDSPLLQFKLASIPQLDKNKLDKLLFANPDFYEAYFLRGELALTSGQLVSAEKDLSLACESFPDSISCFLSLSRLYFALEEYSKSLGIYDIVLNKAPEYRDALLGKVICLSYLGKHQEAMDVCQTMQTLGMYYLGESNYWMAWNFQQLGEYVQARDKIETTKRYMVGSYEVILLSGIINYELGNESQAETELKQVLEINRHDLEAPFYLGKICSESDRWSESGLFFETAAINNERLETTILRKIGKLRDSGFPAERVEKMVRKQKLKLERAQLKKATSFYNAAAGYFNAGMTPEALRNAALAKQHTSFQKLGEDLIQKIIR